MLEHSIASGAGAATISTAIETEIAQGRLVPDTKLPTVRELAASLDVSPATVAAAYRTLKQRGFVVAERARGTMVAPVPPVRVKRAAPLPAARSCSDGPWGQSFSTPPVTGSLTR